MTERILTHLLELDKMLHGGIPKGSVNLVCGVAGTMKSSFAYSILYQHAFEYGTRGLFISLEQRRESLVDQMTTLGIHKELAEDLVILDLARLRRDMEVAEHIGAGPNWMHNIQTLIDSYMKMYEPEMICLDSLGALDSISDLQNPRRELGEFFDFLRNTGMTSFLISEMNIEKRSFGRYGFEEFLADGVFHMFDDRSELGGNVYMAVNKMRNTDFDRAFYPLMFKTGRFELMTDSPKTF